MPRDKIWETEFTPCWLHKLLKGCLGVNFAMDSPAEGYGAQNLQFFPDFVAIEVCNSGCTSNAHQQPKIVGCTHMLRL